VLLGDESRHEWPIYIGVLVTAGRAGCARRVVHPTISVLSFNEQLLQPTVIREHWATVVLRPKNTHVGNKFE